MAFLQIPALVAMAFGTYVLYARLSKPATLPLPPGPKPLPLVGNIADFPPAGVPEFEHWLKHKDAYGGISSVSVMGMTMIFIHDKQMALELLEQRASKTSGRPTMVMANKLCGYESIVLCQSYNARFKHYRKLLHRELGTKRSAAQFLGVQDREVKRQLVRALNEPDRWLDHFKTTAGATVLKMAYDYTVEPHKPDFLVTLIDKMMMEFSLAASPMSWAVDIIPALQYLPEGFPGAGFKKTARKWRRSIEATAYIPYHFVLHQMETQANNPCYVSKLVQQCKSETPGEELKRDDSEAIAWSAASLYGAAADTTVITLTIFTLAMLQNPEVQERAQAEIDSVVGTDRLPTFADRDSLPYVAALVKESTRWWPISPMGFPHTVTEAFDYNGYHIPKDAMLLPAVQWFLHDPSVYANPQQFDPSRFLSPRSEPDPEVEAFGYGRRVCPGRFFADQSLFLNVVHSLACFNIRPLLDSTGKPVPVDVRPKPGILSYPTAFDFKVEVRSEKHKDLILKAEKEVPFEPSNASHLESVDDFEAK